MSKYQQQVLDYIEKNDNFIFPKTRRKEIINRIKVPARQNMPIAFSCNLIFIFLFIFCFEFIFAGSSKTLNE